MKNLKGRVRRLYEDAVRDDLEHYARAADESARKTEQHATALALEAERLNRMADPGDGSIEKTAARYEARDVASFSERLKSEFRFEQTLFGRTYAVLRERAPELGLNFVALLETE